MATVTENWSEEQFSRGKSAERVFTVTDVLGVLEAAEAPGVPELNSRHERDATLLAQSPIVSRLSPAGVYKVRAPYSTVGAGGDPLKRLPKIQWSFGNSSEPVDRDWKDNPILNSARDAFNPPLSAEFPLLFLTITRFEVSFDPITALGYIGHLNADTFNVLGRGNVEPGQVRCLSIAPVSAYTVEDPYIEVAYHLELRRGGKKDSDGLWDGFKRRVLDQGLAALYTDDNGKPARGELFNTKGEQVSTEIRLNGHGAPISDNYQITRYDLPAATVFPPDSVGSDAIDDKDGYPAAAYLKFLPKGMDPVPMSGLRIFDGRR